MRYRYVFGPVPSRRLGSSLGINNVPFKTCSYSCIYCQLGRTPQRTIIRKKLSDPAKIVEEVANVARRGINIDYVTFVPSGEPTLDTSIGESARLIRDRIGLRTAVLTNASLVWAEDVVEDLKEFDLVSFKIDAASEEAWRRINRPHPDLEFWRIIDAAVEFSKTYRGVLLTETMIVRGMVDRAEASGLARIISKISPVKAYISVPIRPPAERWVRPPSSEEIIVIYEEISKSLGAERVALLNMPEPPRFAPPGDPSDYILRLCVVHPLRLDYAIRILGKHYEEPEKILECMMRENLIEIVSYEGTNYILRKIEGRPK